MSTVSPLFGYTPHFDSHTGSHTPHITQEATPLIFP